MDKPVKSHGYYFSVQPKSTMSWNIKRKCDQVAPAPWGVQGMPGAGWSSAQPAPQNSNHFAPYHFFIFRPRLSITVVCYKKTLSLLLKQDHICRTYMYITTSNNSKATWIKCDVKPKRRKLLFVVEVWGIIATFKHSHQIKGRRDMVIWPTYPIAYLTPVSPTNTFWTWHAYFFRLSERS